MKNHLLLTITVFFISIAAFAQDGPPPKDFKEKKEQIKALKIAYITDELKLTPDEATKFWPLYNTYNEKQQSYRRQKMKAFMDRDDDTDSIDKLSEKEAATLLNQMENTDEELYQLRKKFAANLKGILPATKILKLKKAEDEFSRKLLQQYRDRKIGK